MKDRRTSPRYERSLPIAVQPLNEDFTPAGESFDAVTMEFSVGGLSFVSQAQLSALQVAIIVNSSSGALKLISRVRRCRRVDGEYQVAVQFVSKA